MGPAAIGALNSLYVRPSFVVMMSPIISERPSLRCNGSSYVVHKRAGRAGTPATTSRSHAIFEYLSLAPWPASHFRVSSSVIFSSRDEPSGQIDTRLGLPMTAASFAVPLGLE